MPASCPVFRLHLAFALHLSALRSVRDSNPRDTECDIEGDKRICTLSVNSYRRSSYLQYVKVQSKRF